MIRLIGFFVVFALFLVFIVLNLDNKCDVNLGFYTFTESPVYITAFISFFIGMLCTLPVIVSLKKKSGSSPDSSGSKKKNKASPAAQDDIPENGPCGID
jgi:hypothetical protein